MDALEARLLDAGLLIARQGVTGALGMLVAGLLFVGLGARAFRPAVALAAAVGAGALVAVANAWLRPKLPFSPELAIGAGAVLGAVCGLLAPRAGTVVASTGAAALVGMAVAPWVPWRQTGFPALGGVVAGGVAGVLLLAVLPTMLASVLGAGLLAAAAWGYTGASGLSPALFRLPLAWVGLFVLLSGAALLFERVRARRQTLRAHTGRVRAAAAAVRTREESQRSQFGRYENH